MSTVETSQHPDYDRHEVLPICGIKVAYAEPVLGAYEIKTDNISWVCTHCGNVGVGVIKPEDFYRTQCPQCSYCVKAIKPFDWLVIGLLNHTDYAKYGITLEMLAGWIKPLMADADALGIPVFMKSHKLWEKLGIEVRKEWPHVKN